MYNCHASTWLSIPAHVGHVLKKTFIIGQISKLTLRTFESHCFRSYLVASLALETVKVASWINACSLLSLCAPLCSKISRMIEFLCDRCCGLSWSIIPHLHGSFQCQTRCWSTASRADTFGTRKKLLTPRERARAKVQCGVFYFFKTTPHIVLGRFVSL